MAAPKEQEAIAIEAAHRAAQARLGLAAAYLASQNWASVSITGAGKTGTVWVDNSLRIINAVRRKSRELAIAYVQLTRAVDMGRTLGEPISSLTPPSPDVPSGQMPTPSPTLGDLRKQFTDILQEVAHIDTAPSHDPNPDVSWFEDELRTARIEQGKPKPDEINLDNSAIDAFIRDMLDKSSGGDSAEIPVDSFDWGPDTTPEEIDAAFNKVLQEDVLKHQRNKVKKLQDTPDQTPEELITAMEQAHAKTGSIGAGRVDRYGISEGREVLEQVAQKDEYVKAWARGTRPNCCAFCAMLASRGFIFKSEFAAQFTRNTTTRAGNDASPDMDGGFRLYHDNCKCFPILRWVKKPTLPPQNATFEAQWKQVTKGYSFSDGKNNALNAWRRWLSQQRRSGTLHEVDINPQTP